MKGLFYIFLLVSFSATAQNRFNIGGSGSSGSGSSSTASLRVYNVKDYGAKGDSLNDDTEEIQAAINAAHTAGGGTVYFPNGVYLIGGAADATTNAQINIPLSSYQQKALMKHIVFRGETPPHFFSNPIDAGGPPSWRGVVLKSTVTGAINIIGTPWETVGWGQYSYTHLTVENMTIRARSVTSGANIANAATAIDARKLAYLTLKNVKVDNESEQLTMSQPATSAYGIRCPSVSNFAVVDFDRVWVIGYYKAIEVNEHATLQNVFIDACYYGLVFTQANHGAHGDWVFIARTRYALRVEGILNFTIDHLGIEWAPSSSKWFGSVADLDEAVMGSEGYIRWVNGTSGTGRDMTRAFYRTNPAGSKIFVYKPGESNPEWSGINRPSLRATALGYNRSTGLYEFYNGTAWNTVGTLTFNRPPDLPNLKAWYRSDTLVTQGSGVVSSWGDASGGGVTLTASGTAQPAFVAADLNGFPSISSDGVNDYMRSAANFPQAAAYTVYAVALQDATDPSNGRLLDCNYLTGFYIGRNGTADQIVGGLNAAAPPYGAVQAAMDNTWYTIAMRSDGGRSYLSLNGGSESTYTTTFAAANPVALTLFAANNTSTFGKKRLVEVVIYADEHDAATRALVQTYLKNKYAHY